MRILILALLSLWMLSCDSSCVGVACTEEFRSIVVTIQNTAGQPITLDLYTVEERGQMLWRDTGQEDGQYTLLTDALQESFENREATVTLFGFIDNEEVVSQDYVIGADCCHIFLVSGPLEIIIP